MTIGTILIFLAVLAVLIFVHELGHFMAARAFGIRVDAFKIGFGPKVFSWKRGETEYGINWIPFGGYVKIFGENPDEESTTGSDSSRSFVNKPRWQQAIVLAAGVLMNFIFAWILYTGVFTAGVTAATNGFEQYASLFTNPRIMVSSVLPGSPAEKAGLMTGDILEGIASSTDATITGFQNAINASEGHPIIVVYTRGKQVLSNALITPAAGIVEGKYAIGISMDEVADLRLPFLTAAKEGFFYTIGLIKETAVGLYTFIADAFRGSPNFSEVSGPIGIAGIVGNAATLGFTYLLMVTAIISINLGVVNLLPFPALDGGRILFVLIEGVIRRRIPATFTNTVNAIGFALLMILMVAVTWKDVAKLIHG
ncbi:MAG: hypothetical protein JWO00_365 [Candidatus Parcubacteria bacterium]|nr:hypothetical protein [Candidatus Parcubacteria bacterium]